MSINIEKRFFHPSNIKPLLDEICHHLRITNNEGRANTKNTLESIMEEIYDSNQELIESKNILRNTKGRKEIQIKTECRVIRSFMAKEKIEFNIDHLTLDIREIEKIIKVVLLLLQIQFREMEVVEGMRHLTPHQ
jgi:hypothetical protein